MVFDLYRKWKNQKSGKSSVKNYSATSVEALKSDIDFSNLFNYRIYAGDASLVDRCLERLSRQGVSQDLLKSMQVPLTVFLELIIIIRVYLGLEADHDPHVYYLCRKYSASELQQESASPCTGK
jgi:hypothetical protein